MKQTCHCQREPGIRRLLFLGVHQIRGKRCGEESAEQLKAHSDPAIEVVENAGRAGVVVDPLLHLRNECVLERVGADRR